MKKQNGYDKMDESMGMRKGMKKEKGAPKGSMRSNFVKFSLKDNMQSGEMKMVNPDCANMGSK